MPFRSTTSRAARSNINHGSAPARRFYRFFPGLDRIDCIMAPDIAQQSYSFGGHQDSRRRCAGRAPGLLRGLPGYVTTKDNRLDV